MALTKFDLIGGALAATALVLAGCSNAAEIDTTPSSTTNAPVNPVGPVGAQPVNGEIRDVVPTADSTSDHILWKCPDNTDEITLDLKNTTADHNGTLITLEETMGEDNPPNTGMGTYQIGVTIRFGGVPLVARSMIVRSSNSYLWYGEADAPLTTPEFRTNVPADDDQVVALTPTMLSQGVWLQGTYFVFPSSHIDNVSICAPRS